MARQEKTYLRIPHSLLRVPQQSRSQRSTRAYKKRKKEVLMMLRQKRKGEAAQLTLEKAKRRNDYQQKFEGWEHRKKIIDIRRAKADSLTAKAHVLSATTEPTLDDEVRKLVSKRNSWISYQHRCNRRHKAIYHMKPAIFLPGDIPSFEDMFGLCACLFWDICIDLLSPNKLLAQS
jgi:hypothetical protein